MGGAIEMNVHEYLQSIANRFPDMLEGSIEFAFQFNHISVDEYDSWKQYLAKIGG